MLEYGCDRALCAVTEFLGDFGTRKFHSLAMFLPLKFIHPVRTERWRWISLPVALAWVFFAVWAAWVDFHPQSWAHWGLMISTIYLLFAGIVQQIVPAQD